MNHGATYPSLNGNLGLRLISRPTKNHTAKSDKLLLFFWLARLRIWVVGRSLHKKKTRMKHAKSQGSKHTQRNSRHESQVIFWPGGSSDPPFRQVTDWWLHVANGRWTNGCKPGEIISWSCDNLPWRLSHIKINNVHMCSMIRFIYVNPGDSLDGTFGSIKGGRTLQFCSNTS